LTAQSYDFFISKVLYTLIALFGFLTIFFTGLYYGYTFHANEQYFYTNLTEIKAVSYLNNKFVYNFGEYKGTYGDAIAPRIMMVTTILTIIGVILLEVGYRMGSRYKYKDSFKQRLRNFYQNLKKEEYHKGDEK
jgi:hypothetical protein